MSTAVFGFIVFLFIFAIYFLIDYVSMGDPNNFWEKWAKRVMWIWLPLYSLQRLIKEVILKKK